MRDAIQDPAASRLIIDANNRDLDAAAKNNLDRYLLNRLQLSNDKIDAIAKGLQGLAEMPDPIGKAHSTMEITPGLIARREATPLGVLLIVFESRPDALPQIASLGIRSGNAVVLKGGKEATESNTALHSVLTEAIAATNEIPKEAIQLVHGREAVGELLKMDDCFSLVIPRGSNALVKNIQESTNIPVMGHADGVCHVFVDKAAPRKRAVDVTVDSKVDYPAACNAMETLLLHRDIAASLGDDIIANLREKGVQPYVLDESYLSEKHVLLNEILRKKPFDLPVSKNPPKTEWGTLECHVQVVEDVNDAVEWIRTHGSAHTDTIVTEDRAAIETFKGGLESACVFANTSTRFADGFRVGLGAEVGVATGRLHARGPVGVDGLLTYRWVLESDTDAGHTVTQFKDGAWQYTHKPIDAKQRSVEALEDAGVEKLSAQ